MTTGSLPIGTILRSPQESYRVEAVLGHGGFGITYKVSAEKNVQIGNVTQTVRLYFAVKEFFIKGCDRGENGEAMTFASTLASDIKQSRADFLVEAKRLNKLGQLSQHIVKVNEVFEANDTAYYVMEYLDGGSLESYVADHGPLSWNEACRILAPVAEAVELLHKERLLHMDIKPDNIVLKHTNQGDIVPVLIDFGIAKHFDAKGHPTSHLAAKGASDGYAPSEQYADITTFTPEIDVYALGATLFFMLTGQCPPRAFDIRSTNELTSRLPASAGQAAGAILTKAMQPNHFDRLASAKTFAEELRVGETPSDVPVGGSSMYGKDTLMFNPGSQRRPFYKHPAFFILLALVLAAAVTLLCLQTCKSSPKHVEDDEEFVDEDSLAEDSLIDDYADVDTAVVDSVTADSLAIFMAEQEAAAKNAAAENRSTKSQQRQTSSSHGTVNLGYATYTGELRGGRPDGQGTLTFTSNHAIDSRDPSYVASSGDRVVGTFSSGHLSFGKWYKASGEVETIIIGE